MAHDEVNSFLMGGGIPSFKFDSPGDEVTGIISAMKMRDQTDIKTGEVLRWPDGSTRQYLDVTLDTDERDPANPKDDGKRRVFVRWHLQKAVQEAVKDAGADGIDFGGRLTVKFTQYDKNGAVGGNKPKLYAAKYVAPEKSFTAPETDAEASVDVGSDEWAEGLTDAQKTALSTLSPADRDAAVAALKAAAG